ncbi:MAG: hypothetical protein HY319_23105 [Armatimonadetes bacterium]|nr:hypothetical protein [Armatimonadota bacterium]
MRELEIRLAAGRTGILGALFSAHFGTVMLPSPVVSSSWPLVLLSLFYVGVSAADYVMLRLGIYDRRLEWAVALFEPVALSFGLYSVSGLHRDALVLGLSACLLLSALRRRPVALLLCWIASLYLALLSYPGVFPWLLGLGGLSWWVARSPSIQGLAADSLRAVMRRALPAAH